MATTVDHRALARAEREDLVELLADLDPAEWDAATLCRGWRVRDVVAHVYSYEGLGVGRLADRMIRAGLSLRRANAAGVDDQAARGPDELLATARRHVEPSGLTALLGGRIALLDAIIHHQDIRRPLGRPRVIPADRLHAALTFARTAPPIGTPARIRGLTLVATDLDWHAGRGPRVEGPGEALLMAVAGRGGVVPELDGPGVPTLAARISA